MRNEPATSGFPTRDEHGRVVSLAELLGVMLLGGVVGLAALALIDGTVALLGLGDFGDASGWLAAILPGWLLIDDVRAWRGVRSRGLVAVVAAVVGLGLGSLAAAPASQVLPPLGSGAVGALVAALCAGTIWYVWVRRLR